MERANDPHNEYEDRVEGEEGEEGEEEEEIETEEQLNAKLLKAAKLGNLEEVKLALMKHANPLCEDEGEWTPLLWAASKGYEDIVRELIQYDACQPYLQHEANEEYEERKKAEMQALEKLQKPIDVTEEDSEDKDRFKKPQVAAEVGKFTPLHWASYKGFYKVVWILLKKGMSPLDIDIHGNTAVHQASAGGSIKILETFLSRGIDVGLKNARGHTPLDLATSYEVRDLIKAAEKTASCVECGSRFDFANIRYYCDSCKRFFCSKCCISTWVYEKVGALEKERPLCRCINCSKDINEMEEKLRDACQRMDFEDIDKLRKEIASRKLDLEVNLVNEATILHTKLKKQLEIEASIRALDSVTDYKTIKKSVKVLNDLVEEAKKNNIDIDMDAIAEVNRTTARLIAERNLRFQMDLVEIPKTKHDEVKELEGLIQKANETQVSEEYIKKAEQLSQRMNENIKAREILEMMLAYPEREYPEPEVVDPKKKKEKKVVEEDKKKVVKKKKKKEPPFIFPEWASELTAVISQVQNMEHLISNADDIQLDDEFIRNVSIQLARFKKEIAFRKKVEDEEKAAIEAKKLKKKVKGK